MDLQEFTVNNKANAVIASNIPDVTKQKECLLGVDEAGRGPVLGPMVYGIAYCPIESEEDLKSLGCADSKTLTEEKREELFEVLNKNSSYIGWMIEVHSPTTICNNMLHRSKYSLNAISHDSAINLIKRALASGVKVKKVFVDTVGPPDKYQAKLQEIFPDLEITVAKKADSTFPIVSAASICAKVARDRAISSWKFVEGDQFQGKAYGSGYPGDPATKEFLAKNIDPVFGFPNLVRFSWSTAENILEKKAATVLWDEDEEDQAPANVPSVLSFFKREKKDVKPKSHAFFTDRCLTQVVKL